MAHTHDSGYKLLFSNTAFIRDLLLGFVPHEWVRQLDFATLEPLNGHYVSEDMRQRHEDMVWRVRLRGDWLHIYLLLEFQSTPDRFMVLRLLSYIGLFWQQLEKQGQLTDDKRLPPCCRWCSTTVSRSGPTPPNWPPCAIRHRRICGASSHRTTC
ncbi:Rpn family recombination-promoting nuclease/putative transposase [Stutzerimonas kirkiae]